MLDLIYILHNYESLEVQFPKSGSELWHPLVNVLEIYISYPFSYEIS